MLEKQFRSWNKETKCWNYFELPHDLFNYDWLGDKNKYQGWFQYIGIKDKLGEQIFEGDILEDRLGNRRIIEWTPGMEPFGPYYLFYDEWKIVGNVIEDKKLI